MTTNIAETLPWTDYEAIIKKHEDRGRTEGIAEGKTEGIMETQRDIVINAFKNLSHEMSAYIYDI